MSDPRLSEDSDLRAAIAAWDSATQYSDGVLTTALELRAKLRETTSHAAFAWACLTCARIFGRREQREAADLALAEALGRFELIGDEYGHALACASIAMTELSRHKIDRASSLVAKALNGDVEFRSQDQSFLHILATQCCWERGEFHAALGHLMKLNSLANAAGSIHDKVAALANIGLILEEIDESELAAGVLVEALRIAHSAESGPTPFSLSANLVLAYCQLGRYSEALRHAEALFIQLETTATPSAWSAYECVADGFAFNGLIEKAEYCIGRARELKKTMLATPNSESATQLSDAVILEAKGDFVAAIAIARPIVRQKTGTVKPWTLRYAARILARCYSKLGQVADAAKWSRFASEMGRDRLLGPVLSMQLRTDLCLGPPNKSLTDIELTCLSLSARGQSSADIALKLGIKKRTVNFHFANVLRKLNALNRQEAISKAIGANLLRPG